MRALVFIISFFIFSGYYAGLGIIYSLGLRGLSKFYSLPLRFVLALLSLIVIRKYFSNFINNKYRNYFFLFIVFWFIYFLKVLYTENTVVDGSLARSWFEYIFYAVTFVILPFSTYMSIPFSKYKNTILNGFIYSGFIFGLVSTYLYGHLLAKGVGRLNLITYETGEDVLNPLSLSYAGVLTLTLCIFKLAILKVPSFKEKIFLWVTIVVSFVMFLLGSSRGSVVALMLTIPIFIAHAHPKQRLKIVTLILLSIPLLLWAIQASGSSIIDRINKTSEDQGGGRGSLWADAFNHFLENPIFGGRIEIGGIYPHNFIVEILMSTGVVGIILLLPVVIKAFALFRKRVRLDKNSLLIFIIFLQGIVQHTFTAGFYTATLIFIPIGIIFSINNLKEVNESYAHT